MNVQNYPNLRAAASLGIAGVVTTAYIPIAGAVQASFFLLATDGTIPVSAVIQVRKGGGAPVIAAVGVGLTVFGTLGALNAGGIPITVTADRAQAGQAPCIPSWDEARIVFTGNATTAIPGLSIQGQVIDVDPTPDTLAAPSA